MSSALGGGLFSAFLDWIYSTGGISVPATYHERCDSVRCMLDNDISGVINTVLDYSVESASDAQYKIECSENTLEKLLNMWLEKINIDVAGVPTGLQALSKEYFKERWEGSSFCILRFKNWEKITVNGITIEVPTVMWFVNGASVYVKREAGVNYKLGSDKYFLDKEMKNEIPVGKGEGIVIQKPYNRWFDQYPTPYLVRKGVLKNFLAIKTLQEKSDEVISKILPYLFLISKGTENMFLNADVSYSDAELKTLVDNFKSKLEEYKSQKGNMPAQAVPFDQKYEHLIPDLRNILTEDLYRQGYRAILSGLGFVDMLEISPSRQESRLNPKAFLAEVNDGVAGFKGVLSDIIANIIEKNRSAHKKLFTDSGKIIVVNSPLRINIDQMLEALRSGFDRGVISIKTYQGMLGVEYDTEKQRRQNEKDNGDEELFYPHLIQNQEATPDRGIGIPAKPKNQDTETLNKKKGSPEAKNFKNAADETDLEIAPYKTNEDLPESLQYLPEGAKDAFRLTFNKSYPKGEDYAYPVAYTALKRWLKKHGYKKNDKGKWVKAEEQK